MLLEENEHNGNKIQSLEISLKTTTIKCNNSIRLLRKKELEYKMSLDSCKFKHQEYVSSAEQHTQEKLVKATTELQAVQRKFLLETKQEKATHEC